MQLDHSTKDMNCSVALATTSCFTIRPYHTHGTHVDIFHHDKQLVLSIYKL